MEGQVSKTIANYDDRLRALTDARVTQHAGPSLLGKAINYWLRESLIFAHAMACVEIVLLRSDEANAVYRDIVNSWGLPGCQEICNATLPHIPNILPKPLLVDEFVKFLKEELTSDTGSFQALITWLSSDRFWQLTEHQDFQYLHNRIKDLILIGFNRKIDRDNQAWKVTPDNLPFGGLIVIISLRSVAEYYNTQPQDLFQLKVKVADKIHDLNKVGRTPTTRQGRDARQGAIQTLKGSGYVLRHDKTLLELADHWYQSRVIYSGPEEYCREHYKKLGIWLEPTNISRDIAVMDFATGYPRNRHK